MKSVLSDTLRSVVVAQDVKVEGRGAQVSARVDVAGEERVVARGELEPH